MINNFYKEWTFMKQNALHYEIGKKEFQFIQFTIYFYNTKF